MDELAVIKDTNMVRQYAKQAKALVRDAVAASIGYNISEEELVLFGSAALLLQGAYRYPRDLDFSIYDPQIFDLMKASLRDFAEAAKVSTPEEMPNALRFRLANNADIDLILTGPLFEPYTVRLDCSKLKSGIVCEQKEHIVERVFHHRLGSFTVKALLDFTFIAETNESFASTLLTKYPSRKTELAQILANGTSISELLSADYLSGSVRRDIIQKLDHTRRLVEREPLSSDTRT
jgi:hypothetical protein